MRAAILPAFKTPFEIRDDVNLTGPGPNEVRVRVVGSGLCGSDLILQDHGREGAQLPLIIGHEAAGIITAMGANVTGLKEGDHVILSRVTSCGLCADCASGHSYLCRALGTPGSASGPPARSFANGDPVYGLALAAHAEETIVHANAAIKIPDDVPLQLAAIIGCCVTTGVGAAFNTAHVTPGSSVIVMGSGGVGLNVIQGARICGATDILAVDPVESRREDAKFFGATAAVHPQDADGAIAEITGGLGFDYAFESIGKTEALATAIKATRRGGKAIIVGMDGEISVGAQQVAFRETQILGSYYGSANVRTEFPRLIHLWRSGQLKLEELVTKRIDVSAINDAYDALRKGVGIRTVVDFGS